MESPQTSVPPPFYCAKVSDELFCLITPLSKLLAFPKKNWKNNPGSGYIWESPGLCTLHSKTGITPTPSYTRVAIFLLLAHYSCYLGRHTSLLQSEERVWLDDHIGHWVVMLLIGLTNWPTSIRVLIECECKKERLFRARSSIPGLWCVRWWPDLS